MKSVHVRRSISKNFLIMIFHLFIIFYYYFAFCKTILGCGPFADANHVLVINFTFVCNPVLTDDLAHFLPLD